MLAIEESAFSNYIETMRDEKKYGGPVEVAAASAYLKHPITVINTALTKDYEETYEWDTVDGQHGTWDQNPIYLGFMPVLEHYETLRIRSHQRNFPPLRSTVVMNQPITLSSSGRDLLIPSAEPGMSPSVPAQPRTLPNADPVQSPSVPVQPRTLPNAEPVQSPSVPVQPRTLSSTEPAIAVKSNSLPTKILDIGEFDFLEDSDHTDSVNYIDSRKRQLTSNTDTETLEGTDVENQNEQNQKEIDQLFATSLMKNIIKEFQISSETQENETQDDSKIDDLDNSLVHETETINKEDNQNLTNMESESTEKPICIICKKCKLELNNQHQATLHKRYHWL